MQSLIDAGEIAHALNAMYDKGIDHAIEVVKELEHKNLEEFRVRPYAMLEKIIEQLSKLKSNGDKQI